MTGNAMRPKGPVLMTVTILILIAMTLRGDAGSRGRADRFLSLKNHAEVAERIRAALKNRSYRVTISFDAKTEADGDKLKALTDEMMEEALYESDDPAGGDYIRYQLGGYRMNYGTEKGFLKQRTVIRLRPFYYTSREEEEYVDQSIARIVRELKEELPEDAGDAERIRLVHDYVTGLLDYDTVHRGNSSNHKKTTAYAALRYHTVVCQGYAVLTYRLLKEMAVECRIITGDAVYDGKKERHAWLIVRLGDSVYCMDPTFDDVNDCYDWYLKTPAEFAADHTPDGRCESIIIEGTAQDETDDTAGL